IRSRLGPFLRRGPPAIEHAREDVPKPATAGGTLLPAPLKQIRKVEATKIKMHALRPGRPAGSRLPARAPSRETTRPATLPRIRIGRCRIDVVGIKSELVVDLPLLRIAENFIRFRDRLELLLRSLIPGIHVGVILARKFAKRLPDFLRRRPLLNPQRAVIIFCLCIHGENKRLATSSWLLA